MKIAILLGDSRLESIIRARALAEAFLEATPMNGESIQVTIGLPVVDDGEWKRQAEWLRAGSPAIMVRRLDWREVPVDNALRMHESAQPFVSLARCSSVLLPQDWGNNFTDCAAWVVLAEPGLGAVYPIRPTVFFCVELASRRTPYAFCDDFKAPFWDRQLAAFQMWRQAGFVVTTDRLTAADIVSYAGVSPDRVLYLPNSFDLHEIDDSRSMSGQPQRLMIRMEPDSLHDADATLRGLHLYLSEGGELQPVIACEMSSAAFGSQSNIPAVVALPIEVRHLVEELPIEQLTTAAHWARLLYRASAVWSPRLSGQGSHLDWPLRVGRPLLSADHPIAREVRQRVGSAIVLYSPGCPSAVADALHSFAADLASAPEPHLAAADRAVQATQATLIVDRLLEIVDD